VELESPFVQLQLCPQKAENHSLLVESSRLCLNGSTAGHDSPLIHCRGESALMLWLDFVI
jgi:hypothetical protein